MSNKCLVIGGGGFIGRHLVRQLIERGRSVVVLGRRPISGVGLPEPCRYVSGDYGNRAVLAGLLAECSEVVDLAYSTVPKTSFGDPVFDLLSNLPAGVGLLQEACLNPVKKMVFVSSGGTVYGEAARLPIAEDHPTAPISPYGITKLAIEKYAQMYCMISNVPVAIARPANAYGEEQLPGTGQGFVAAAINAVALGRPVDLFGEERSVRDYLHVSDVASGIMAVLDSGAPGECYNIGSGTGSTNGEILDMLRPLAEKSGREITVNVHPRRGFDVKNNILDASKLAKLSGWKPQISLRRGITQVWSSVVQSAA